MAVVVVVVAATAAAAEAAWWLLRRQRCSRGARGGYGRTHRGGTRRHCRQTLRHSVGDWR